VVGPIMADRGPDALEEIGPMVVVLMAEDLEAEATPPAVVLAGGLPVFSALSLESSRRGRTTKPSGLQCAPDFQGDVDAPSRVSIR
jgi:hypothetical protein